MAAALGAPAEVHHGAAEDIGAGLPSSLTATREGEIAFLTLNRAAKRNALDDTTLFGLEAFFRSIPEGIKVVILSGNGDHFSAGLDLGELTARTVSEGIVHSRSWHRAMEAIEFGPVPVVSVLHGAVVGGGLELASASHIRVAEESAYFALPEGQRGIYVGGGASVRVPRLVGMQRMRDMMLTGRTYGAEEGRILGFCDYVVPAGGGLEKARALATRIAANAPLTNFALVQVLPRIVEMDPASGYLTEALMAAIAQGDAEAKRRLEDFLAKRAPKALHV